MYKLNKNIKTPTNVQIRVQSRISSKISSMGVYSEKIS